MSDGKRKEGTPASGLLGDLESIRSLLDEQEEESPSSPRPPPEEAEAPAEAHDLTDPDEDVPLLEDVVHGGVSVSEAFLSGEGDFIESSGPSRLNDEIFKALLSDEWRDAARGLLDEARAGIEQHQAEWTPRHTDELNQTLKLRIDETVQEWLREVVQNRIDELGALLLQVVSSELRAAIDRQIHPSTRDENPDAE